MYTKKSKKKNRKGAPWFWYDADEVNVFGQSTYANPVTKVSDQSGSSDSALFGEESPPPPAGRSIFISPSSLDTSQSTTQAGNEAFSVSGNTSVFGNAGANQNTPIFGQSGTSAFGAAKPSGFGFGSTQPNTSIFGQASTSTATGAGFFGQQNAANSSIFGATPTPAFGAATAGGNSGTAIAKYQPSIGQDTLVKNGQANSVPTKQHCITTMKEYEGKSVEELRIEDYMAKGTMPEVITLEGITPEDFVKAFPATEKIDASAKVDKPETDCKTCKFIAKENAILRAQITKIAKFRTSVQGLGQCLNAITLYPPIYPPFSTDTAEQTSSAEKVGADSSGSLPVIPIKTVSLVPPYHKVFGEAENEDSLPTISNNRWLFVTRFARSVTEDNICDYMARKLSTKRRPVCIGLTRPQDHPLKAASFKVELLPGEFAEALTPDFWGKGVVASEYKPPINRVTSVSSLVSEL